MRAPAIITSAARLKRPTSEPPTRADHQTGPPHPRNMRQQPPRRRSTRTRTTVASRPPDQPLARRARASNHQPDDPLGPAHLGLPSSADHQTCARPRSTRQRHRPDNPSGPTTSDLRHHQAIQTGQPTSIGKPSGLPHQRPPSPPSRPDQPNHDRPHQQAIQTDPHNHRQAIQSGRSSKSSASTVPTVQPTANQRSPPGPTTVVPQTTGAAPAHGSQPLRAHRHPSARHPPARTERTVPQHPRAPRTRSATAGQTQKTPAQRAS